MSEEIYGYQQELQSKIACFNALLKKTDLPLVHENESPIFFIGTGTMDMGNHLVQELIRDGIYVNLATFPAVPAKNIGIRITISRNNSVADIEQLVAKLSFHFNRALAATGQTLEKIRKAFKMAPVKAAALPASAPDTLTVSGYSHISQLDAAEWNQYLGHRGAFDYQALLLLEQSFGGNAEPENNWRFRYYVVRDPQGQPVLMTFAVAALHKEDMFAQASVSKAIEKERETNPYYLTATGITMGSLFTEGNHLYLDRQSPWWKKALQALITQLYQDQEKENAASILLRDLDAGDQELDEFMVEQDFVRLDLPESCVVTDLSWRNEEEYRKMLSRKSREHFVPQVKRNEHLYEVVVKAQLADEELQHAIGLFRQVKAKNFAINNFLFPEKLFHQINAHPDWEFVLLYLKEEYAPNNRKAVSVCFCHKNCQQVYSPMWMGMDYAYGREYGIYRQTLYQVLRRANALHFKQVNLGISASVEKKKLGATVYPKVGYYQAKDNFALEMIQATIAIEKD
jgi:hypothetical protein